MNLTELINELDEELNGRKGLFNRRVDITRCVEIFEEIKRLLPPALTEAELVVKSREKILDNADTVAQNIIKEAEERAVPFVRKLGGNKACGKTGARYA